MKKNVTHIQYTIVYAHKLILKSKVKALLTERQTVKRIVQVIPV